MSKDSLQSPKARKLGYSSQLAFVISLIAGSVGTGNIWRFPRVAAANGGAFVLAYIIMMFIVIIPVMMGEHFMGRRSRLTDTGAETEHVPLPEALEKRLAETRAKLDAIE